MTVVGYVLIVAGAAWLGVLTFVVLLCVRQIGIVQVAIRLGVRDAAAALGSTSLPIGAAIPNDAAEVLDVRSDARHIVFVSAQCSACRDVLNAAGNFRSTVPVVIAVQGPQPEASEYLKLIPTGARAVVGRDADIVFGAFKVTATPFAVTVDEGFIVGHVYLSDLRQLDRVITGVHAVSGDASANGDRRRQEVV
jgi:hypothetical protein